MRKRIYSYLQIGYPGIRPLLARHVTVEHQGRHTLIAQPGGGNQAENAAKNVLFEEVHGLTRELGALTN